MDFYDVIFAQSETLGRAFILWYLEITIGVLMAAMDVRE